MKLNDKFWSPQAIDVIHELQSLGSQFLERLAENSVTDVTKEFLIKEGFYNIDCLLFLPYILTNTVL
jgi:hypothetical protein